MTQKNSTNGGTELSKSLRNLLIIKNFSQNFSYCFNCCLLVSLILLEAIYAKQSLSTPPPATIPTTVTPAPPPFYWFLVFPYFQYKFLNLFVSAKLHVVIGVMNFAGKLNWTKDASGSSTVGRKEIETVQQLDKIRVDESCFMVNGAELHFHPQREGKHKTYQVL